MTTPPDGPSQTAVNLPPLSEEQARAVDLFRAFATHPSPKRNYAVLHGLAGTGKTVTLAHIAREFPSAWVATLTGKAADVLSRKIGVTANTIHSLFYVLEQQDIFDGDVETLKFRSANRDYMGQLVILDEVSMIGTQMARDLLNTGCRIIAAGDPGQLPPIEGEQFFTDPDRILTQVHRQALESPIIRQAHAVRYGGEYRSDGDGFQVIDRVTDAEFLRADVVLTWTRLRRTRANVKMRNLRGFHKEHPEAGEIVVCKKNNRDFGVFNGSVYVLAEDFEPYATEIAIRHSGSVMRIPRVKFEGMPSPLPRGAETTRFDYGYAFTVHAAQGSEWPHVLIVDEYPRHKDDWNNFVYTAVTRASERVRIIRV